MLHRAFRCVQKHLVSYIFGGRVLFRKARFKFALIERKETVTLIADGAKEYILGWSWLMSSIFCNLKFIESKCENPQSL